MQYFANEAGEWVLGSGCLDEARELAVSAPLGGGTRGRDSQGGVATAIGSWADQTKSALEEQ
jgi:hypothetical protein